MERDCPEMTSEGKICLTGDVCNIPACISQITDYNSQMPYLSQKKDLF